MPIRIATSTLFLLAAALACLAPVPDELPPIALGQASVYRVEILLALLYGGLLILTPLFYGAFRGQLPIELSHRGAKWHLDPTGLESADRQIEELEAERAELLRERRQLEAAAVVGGGRER